MVITILGLKGAGGQTNQTRRLTARDIAQRTLPSVVLLVTEDSDGKPMALGSGFFVQNDVIATNFHVIEGGEITRVKLAGGKAVYGAKFQTTLSTTVSFPVKLTVQK